MAFRGWLFEAIVVGASVAILVIYHWRFWSKTRAGPDSTATGRHRLARAAWIRAMRDGRNQLVVVQTLRNWIMASTFLASTAIFFALGLLGAAFTTDKLSSFAHELNFLGSEDQQLWLFKALLLIVNFLAAFFNFSLAVRSFIHASFAVETRETPDKGPGTQVDGRELERGAVHYTLGMRAFYMSIPLSLWLFGPFWMFVGAVGLVVILSRVD